MLKNILNKSIHTYIKLLVYKSHLKSISIFGFQLLECIKKNVNIIKIFQNTALRKLANASPFVSNTTLHKDFSIRFVDKEARCFY